MLLPLTVLSVSVAEPDPAAPSAFAPVLLPLTVLLVSVTSEATIPPPSA